MDYYVNGEYIKEIWPILQNIKSKEYYVNMAIAWCYSMIYVTYPDLIESYLLSSKQTSFDESSVFVHNKAIQKIVESKQVLVMDKENIRKLRIY